MKVSYVTDLSRRRGRRRDRRVPRRHRRPTIGGAVVEADGFEADDGAWAVEDPPAGSPPGTQGNFAITQELIPVAASVATRDTALLGFGIESLATPTAQAEVLGRVLEPLLQR